MPGLTYDSGALIAAERGDRRMWVIHGRALAREESPVVPAAVLAQVWRGGSQVALSRLLRGCWIEPLDGLTARSTGVALARSRTADVPDATVVAGAMQRNHTIITSDRGDIEWVAQALGWRPNIIDI